MYDINMSYNNENSWRIFKLIILLEKLINADYIIKIMVYRTLL